MFYIYILCSNSRNNSSIGKIGLISFTFTYNSFLTFVYLTWNSTCSVIFEPDPLCDHHYYYIWTFHGDRDIKMGHSIFHAILKKMEINLGADSISYKKLLKSSFLFSLTWEILCWKFKHYATIMCSEIFQHSYSCSSSLVLKTQDFLKLKIFFLLRKINIPTKLITFAY